MKPKRARMRWRLKGTIFALSIAAMATQVGGATMSPRVAAELPAPVSAAAIPLPGERELLIWLASVLRTPPVSGGWALLLAGLTGVWAIAWRRMSAPDSRSLDAHGLRR